ncbi:MAG TPA: flagellar hook protein FlgE [Clostridia bacterium]|nr:flagellar hook protein FlgE [Clostridia bacterium]
MMRSMFSGVSGLRAHQLKMDTIGNNIANVNTVGYKSQRATFQEVFNQTLRGAGSPQAGKGGTNPQQVGLGISLSSIDTFHVRGAVQRTDNLTDLAINGDGFFILSNSNDTLNRTYTRAGNFSLDDDGNLVAANGYKVLGYMVDPDTGVMKSSLEGIKISKAEMVEAKATTYANFEGNLDLAIKRIPVATLADNSVTPNIPAYPSYDDTTGTLHLATETKYWETTTTVYDSLGGKHNYKFTFIRGLTDDGATNGAENDWGVIIQDQDTKAYFTEDGEPSDTGATLADLVIPIKFNEDGTLDTTTSGFVNSVTLSTEGNSITEDLNVKIDFKKLTQFANESNAAVTSSDGYPQGSLDTFSIGPTGEISGIFTNGQSKVIGQLALAAFKNPAGLEKTAENMYQVTPNSGDPITSIPGSSGLGAINSGTLEMSNVDISREFADMISTQRGFQANSRIITTSDEMLQELVNLKR